MDECGASNTPDPSARPNQAIEIVEDEGFGRVDLSMMRAGVALVQSGGRSIARSRASKDLAAHLTAIGDVSRGYGFIRQSSEVIAANTPRDLPDDATMPRIMRDATRKFFPAAAAVC